MKWILPVVMGIVLVLLVSGCTQTNTKDGTQTNTENGGTVKQISMENLVSAGNIKINENYPNGSIENAIAEGCKQGAVFRWVENIEESGRVYPILKASFIITECNENVAEYFLDLLLSQSSVLPINYTISTVEVKKIELDSGETELIWREGEFFIIVTGETLEYAQQVAEALIDSYK